MTEDRKENRVQDEAVREASTSKETEGLTRRRVLKGAAAAGAAVAVAYAPPSLRRIAMPSALAKTSPGKEDGEKDPASDKSGDKTSDKDPNMDKDPGEKAEEKTTDKNPVSDKDPNEKDPTSDKGYDKDPEEKTKESELRSEIPDFPKLARVFFDEWKA